MKTFESMNSLVRILGLPDLLSQSVRRYTASGCAVNRRPHVPGAEESEVAPVFHEGRPHRFRFRREEPRPDHPVQELGLRPAKLESQGRFHRYMIVIP